LPYLRDEFRFTCVYCLRREGWVKVAFHSDHWLPKNRGGPERHTYTNLLYACGNCNSIKGDDEPADDLPHPEEEPYGRYLEIQLDGRIVARMEGGRASPKGMALIKRFHLYLDELYTDVHRRYRRLFAYLCRGADAGDEEAIRLRSEFFGVPQDEAAKLKRKKGAVRPYASRESAKAWF
jgi:hypothetical protein